MKQINNLIFILFCVSHTACGGGGSSGGGSAAPTVDATGTWSVDTTVYAADCDEGTYGETYTAVMTQNGSSATMTIAGYTFDGTISGNEYTFTGSYPEDGGTTSETVVAIVNDVDDSFTSTSEWTWTGDGTSCSGSTTSSGQKLF